MATSYQQNTNDKMLSAKDIRKAKRALQGPFQLQLRDYAKPLLVETIVRIIPKKRFVAFGYFEGKPVAIKCFFDAGKAKKHADRDARGIKILLNNNIPTPALLAEARDASGKLHFLIFEKIQDAYNLDWLWQQKTDVSELAPLIRATTIELATQHVSGIKQRDLHLKNFLIANKKIYTLDGDSIEQIPEPLSKKDSIEHLALFFSQLGAGTDEFQKELFDLYANSRSWIVRPEDTALFIASVKKWRKERTQRFQKKILRNSSAFYRMDNLTALMMLDRQYQSESFLRFLKNPESFFAKPETEILKAGNSSTVAKIKIDDKYFVIKRYNMKSFFHWLRRAFRASRAQQSWRLSHQLLLNGIPTAKPVAFVEKHFLGLRHKSYFLMEYIDGKDLGEYFSTNSEKQIMATRVKALINQLAEIHFTHGDLKKTNILINQNRPVLIDLDGMQKHKCNFSLNRALKSEFQRFLKNWENEPSLKNLFG